MVGGFAFDSPLDLVVHFVADGIEMDAECSVVADDALELAAVVEIGDSADDAGCAAVAVDIASWIPGSVG